MMDSQDNILLQETPEENELTATQAEETTTVEAAESTERHFATKEEVLERVKEIAHAAETPAKDEVEHLKSVFYRLLFAEREAQQKEYLDAGGDPEKYQVLPDDTEAQFKAEMGVIKEQRAKAFQKMEEEKQQNLRLKLELIEKIKGMSTSPDEANKAYNDFKALQQEWREIKAVPAEKANELWRNYQLYVEQYYDLLNLNREAREYDFKKNLEQKTALCEAAEKLAETEDMVSASHQLQELHQQYREIGPVAKELREEVWARFKAASTIINKKHQQYFESLRAKEEENLAKKTVLCEQVEAIAKEENKGAADWERHTKQIIALQAEWKTIGFAPQKMNVKIFERFRTACDDFFGRKVDYFKQLKERFAENTQKKRELVAKAVALKDSTEWRSTADKLINLQKEWKTIGMTPKKVGDALWNEFIGACNAFFDARNTAQAGTKNDEHQNLEKKRGIIRQLQQMVENAADATQESVRQLVEEYNQIGHVPFKEKDKLYKQFREATDAVYKQLNISVGKQRLDNFKTTLKNLAKQGEDSVDNERARLMRRYEQLKSEITTYENNIGFLNASSKKGNSLVDEMNRKVGRLKDDLEMLRQKIKTIDNGL